MATRTRMNKHVESDYQQISTGEFINSFQIESGAEEVQLKRILLTATADGKQDSLYTVQFALSDEAFASSADFTASRQIFWGTFGAGTQFMWNETQTIRVPREHHLGIRIDGSAANSGTPEYCRVATQVNYLVLG